jgi:Tfp pilus assembly protein PilO
MRNSQSLHWMGVVKWVLILGLASVLGLSYMFCKNQNMRLADETHELRLKLDRIEQHNRALSLDLEIMKSPAQMKRRLAEMGSTLVPLYDPRMLAHVTRMEGESTRMTLERMGTIPNVNLPPQTVDGTDTTAPIGTDPQ